MPLYIIYNGPNPTTAAQAVVTTGTASMTAVQKLRDYGYVVDTVLTIVDRQAGGRAALGAMGLAVHALFDVSDFPSQGTR